MSEDEEYAELLLELEESRKAMEGASSRLRYSQVGFRESLLMSIDSTLKAIRAEAPIIAARSNGGKAGKPKYPDPWPLPVPAVDRLRARREKAKADAFARLFGVPDEDL
ncbi:hypothetical protein [Nesterenkonia suensis]